MFKGIEDMPGVSPFQITTKATPPHHYKLLYLQKNISLPRRRFSSSNLDFCTFVQENSTFDIQISEGDLMKDDKKTKKQLVCELTELRSQNAELKKSITGSVSAALAVDEARCYAESIVETVRESLLVLDADLKIISANCNFYRTFKVTPGETIGSFIYDLGNKQWDIHKLRLLLEETLPNKETFNDFEVDHNFQDIGHKSMLLNAREIYRKDIGTKMILLAIEDITERKEIEASLERTRKELAVIKIAADEVSEYAESVINTVREPLIALDQDLRVVKVSRSFYDFFKVNPEETMGQLIYDLGNKQWDIPKLRELLETILPQKTTFDNYEVERDFSTIGRRTMLLNARQIKRVFGKERIILLAIEDITERRQAEQALKESEGLFRSLVENILDPVILIHWDGTIDFVNPATARMTETETGEEVIGHNITEFLLSEEWERAFETIELFRQDKGHPPYEFRMAGRKGTVRYVDASPCNIIYHGDPVLLITLRDITQKKEWEKRIKELNEALRDRLSEVLEAKALEEKANRGKTEFLANISHELTTPLNSIIGFSQVLLTKNFGDINEKQRGYLENIFDSGERLHDTLKNIVSFVSIDVTNPDMDWEDLRLKEIAASSLSIFRKAAADRHLTITLDMAKEADRTIRADRGKLVQVFHNLLSNAVKFSREGGQITISVRNRKGSEESGKDNFIEITVEDRGIGIREEDLPRLFRPFEQLEAPLIKQFAGVGMGLILTRKLIEAHGGAIRVESDYGKGTKVIFTISVKDRHEK
jgi:PAS domain S-box-containing protein